MFVGRAACNYYLDNLRFWKQRLGIKIHSYCLMTNHVHLIVEPGDRIAAVSELMKRLAAGQTRHINNLEGRAGALWSSRYKISAIDRDDYLLECCRYIELNPVKAGFVSKAEDYEWSSYRSRIGQTAHEWLDIDSNYMKLGSDDEGRRAQYRKFVEESAATHRQFIQNAIGRNQLTGSHRFIDEIESKTGIRIEHRGPGRPKLAKTGLLRTKPVKTESHA